MNHYFRFLLLLCSHYYYTRAFSHTFQMIIPLRRHSVFHHHQQRKQQQQHQHFIKLSTLPTTTPTSWSTSGSKSTAISSRQTNDTDEEKQETPAPFLRVVNDVLFKLFSYCIQVLGVAFSLGLVLNLCGFGYTFDWDRGLEIDRLENIRNEVQFEREIRRGGR